MKRYNAIISACFFSVFFLALSIYEGSNILDDPFDWERSTPFTQLLIADPSFPTDIVFLDYFVYAIKFYPFYPILALISGVMLFVLSLPIINRDKNTINILLVLMGILGISLSVSFFSAQSFGSAVYRYSFVIMGLFLTIYGGVSIARNRRTA
ncbi:protein of unknown function [Terribacillus halophilus]|uniref:DUF4306 domain-containing protein n=1 Tax=Terribacillus halophilus TaxID=361279 RepID=A0A1G6PPJ6_9BACI|nr:DUF4306 domain-containing protein [Terribacillus halophilus]SDC81891.1 protein of unknown function [Terribacillus halophilus]